MDEFRREKPCQTAYLAGAGISIPSGIPGASAFIRFLVEFITDDSKLREDVIGRTFNTSAGTLYQCDFLRFEAVLSCIRLSVDPELHVLQVYCEGATPNAYHFFLAEQLKLGAVVMTTNFDNLIETACRMMNVPYSLIVDDEEYSAFCHKPEAFKNPLIKLHGGYDPINAAGVLRPGAVNVKATLEQVGRVFFSEGSKASTSILSTILRTRNVVVIGYSGCDDFDIMPCIMSEPKLRGLTWIDHSSQSLRVWQHVQPESPELPPYRLLAARGNGTFPLQVISGDTAEALGIDMGSVLTQRFDWTGSFRKWRQEYLADRAHQQLLLGTLLFTLEQHEKSASILENVPSGALSPEQHAILRFLLCNLYVATHDTDRAIICLFDMTEHDEQLGSLSVKGFAYYNLARINTDNHQYDQARRYLGAAIHIFTDNGDSVRLSDCIHEMGRIFIDSGDSQQGIGYIQQALSLSKTLGDLSGAAVGEIEIARALYHMNKPDEAEVHALEALRISELISNYSYLGGAHHALGYTYSMRGEYERAVEAFSKAVVFERKANDRLDLGHSLHSLGNMYMCLGQLDKARDYLEESISVKTSIQDKQGISNSKKLLQIIKQLVDISRNIQ